MHKNHLVGCAVGIALALVVVALSGGSAGGLGILVAALICPIAMTAAMYFFMGGNQKNHPTETNLDEPTKAHR